MGKITLIIGGARSGKSAFAGKLADEKKGKIAFIASCEPLDDEMRERVARHKKARPAHWETFEEPLNIAGLLKKIGNKFDLILIDCLTLFLCNLMLKEIGEKEIEKEVKEIIRVLASVEADSIIVSNEVGLGIVPQNKLSRGFRDMAGRTNQMIAKNSQRVFFLAAGIPLKIKDGENG